MLKHVTKHYLEMDDNKFPLPFDPGGEPAHFYLSANGLKAIVGFLVQDDSPADPFEEFEEGDFYQFDHRYKHDTPRPDIEDFKRIVRANPGRVVTVDRCGDGYRAGELVTPADCRGRENSRAERLLDDADGYYIVPEDVTDAARYAKGAIEQYSAWCEGDVYGVIVWEYTRESIDDAWEDPGRDMEVWGFYGYRYASEELRGEFGNCFDVNTIERRRYESNYQHANKVCGVNGPYQPRDRPQSFRADPESAGQLQKGGSEMKRTISNQDDVIDSRDIISLIEELEAQQTPRFVAGWNMPGYMPDNVPEEFDNADDAKSYIIEELENYLDQLEDDYLDQLEESGDGEEVAARLREVKDALAGLKVSTDEEHAFNAGQYHYFITEDGTMGLDEDEQEELTNLKALADGGGKQPRLVIW